jgi:predicted nucleotidyltransferase
MRVQKEQMQFLKQAVMSRARNAKVYLFGSRVDDNKKGGDIDILILSEQKLSLKDKALIRYSFYEKYGEQKLDLVNYRFEEASNFKELALLGAVEI